MESVDTAAVGVNYATFESLTNRFADISEEAFIEMQHTLTKDKNEWRNLFEFLDNFRIVNKFGGTAAINKHLPPFLDTLKALVDSIRSNLSKNALILVTEIFSKKEPQVELLPEITFLLVTVSLEKSINDKVFIKNEAKGALKNLEAVYSQNIGSIEGVITLCNEQFNKNALIAENASNTLTTILVNQIRELFFKINSTQQGEIIHLIAKAFDLSKRAVITKNCEKILLMFQEIVGSENLESYLQPNCGAELSKKVIDNIKAKDKNKANSSQGFQAFLQSKKKAGADN